MRILSKNPVLLSADRKIWNNPKGTLCPPGVRAVKNADGSWTCISSDKTKCPPGYDILYAPGTPKPISCINLVTGKELPLIKYNFNGDYSYFDANGKPENSAETKLFHDWLDARKPGWHSLWGSLNKDTNKGYGSYPFSPATELAWKRHGNEFISYAKNVQIVSNKQDTPLTNPNLTFADPKGNTKKGQFWNKAKGVWVKAKESGIIDALGNFIQPSQQQQGNWQGSETTTDGGRPGATQKDEGVSSGTIALIVGGVVVLGLLVWYMTKTDTTSPAK